MSLITAAWILVAIVLVAAVGVRALGGDLRLVDHWKLSFRYYTTYGYALLAFLPDFWNALVAANVFDGMEGDFTLWQNLAIKALVAWNLFTQQIKQIEPPAKPVFDRD